MIVLRRKSFLRPLDEAAKTVESLRSQNNDVDYC